MKKTLWTAVLGFVLTCMLCVPALAQATGIAVDGKTYTFVGAEGTYEAEGKTFIIGTNAVTIKEEGKPDRVLELTKDNSAIAQNDFEIFIEEDEDDSTAYAMDNVSGSIAEYSQFTYTTEDEGKIDPSRFDVYAEFGLSYDAQSDALYYQGRRVRIFEDSYPLDDQACSTLEYLDDQGTIDVKTQRDLSKKVYNADGSCDPSGTLTGIYALTSAECAARDLNDWTRPQPQQGTAVSGEEMTAQEKQEMYAPYAEFGLAYNAATDTLTYQGQQVRRFLDIKQSNGEALDSGRFHGVMTCIGGDEGEIDVQTVRDYTKPDAEGFGKLIGMISEKVK